MGTRCARRVTAKAVDVETIKLPSEPVHHVLMRSRGQGKIPREGLPNKRVTVKEARRKKRRRRIRKKRRSGEVRAGIPGGGGQQSTAAGAKGRARVRGPKEVMIRVSRRGKEPPNRMEVRGKAAQLNPDEARSRRGWERCGEAAVIASGKFGNTEAVRHSSRKEVERKGRGGGVALEDRFFIFNTGSSQFCIFASGALRERWFS